MREKGVKKKDRLRERERERENMRKITWREIGHRSQFEKRVRDLCKR